MARKNEQKPKIEEEFIKEIYNPDDLIFALDIGTRTVVGIVGAEEEDKFKVIAVEVIEHKNRAMLNGQIHDISLVAEIVEEVKEKLEKKLGLKLEKVAIAAAGRVLKTYSVKVERETESNKEITRDVVSSLELEGIQLAQSKIEEEQSRDDRITFYCVGYSVISYYINGYVISSMLGHKARNIGVEVLATFLPHVVIDSLYTVMNRVGLEVVNLTLEPIAAINVSIPQNLRLLNLALVDVGAGTSDIAITKDGAVIAYAMAPVAGDEITEKIVHHYLVDFNTAEKIKLELNEENGQSIEFIDVLNIKRKVDKKEIFKVIKDSVDNLGNIIADKILEYNNKAPNAVFCVGGGSQIKGLTEVIADKLGLPHERVAVRGRDIIQSIKFSGKKLDGPEAITPLGIAVYSMMQKEQDFLSVMLNGKIVRLFNAKKLNVADALIMVGYDPKQLIGRSGKSIAFELDGEKKTIKGEFGKAAVISVNGQMASMETALKPGDAIEIIPAQNGKPASTTVEEIIDMSEKKVTYNRLTIDISPKVTINGEAASSSTPIHDGDKVKVLWINTVEEFAKSIEIDISKFKVLINGDEVNKDHIIEDGDKLELIEISSANAALNMDETEFYAGDDSEVDYYEDYMDKSEQYKINRLTSVIDVTEEDLTRKRKKKEKNINVKVNGNEVTLEGNKSEYIFIDVFNTIDFDLSKVKGTVGLKLNGRKAGYTDAISEGDIIEIIWESN